MRNTRPSLLQDNEGHLPYSEKVYKTMYHLQHKVYTRQMKVISPIVRQYTSSSTQDNASSFQVFNVPKQLAQKDRPSFLFTVPISPCFTPGNFHSTPESFPFLTQRNFHSIPESFPFLSSVTSLNVPRPSLT
jgi:hypothetical protein